MKNVLVGGCFDLIHYGHIVFLKNAKQQGDYLIVALESDENVKQSKGEGRPIHTQDQRSEMLESLEMVDEVIKLPLMTSDKDYFELVEKIKPKVIAVTASDPQLKNKQKQAKRINAKVVEVTSNISPYSSTHILSEI